MQGALLAQQLQLIEGKARFQFLGSGMCPFSLTKMVIVYARITLENVI